MSYTDFDEMSQTFWNRAMYDDIIETFIARSMTLDEDLSINKEFKVLDIGCGPAGFSLALLRKFSLKEIHLLDVREDGLEKAKVRIEDEHPKTKVHIIKADVHNIPLKEDSYDIIISRGSMQFWEDQEQALKEINRVLKPNGIAYLGGGKGSVAFQEKRKKEDNEWSLDNFNKDNLRQNKMSSNKLKNCEYEEFFKENARLHKIYSHLGDGHWMIWKKGGEMNV